jgi:hypothetical protein
MICRLCFTFFNKKTRLIKNIKQGQMREPCFINFYLNFNNCF